MEWIVLYDEEFLIWLEQQEVGLQDSILALVNVLIEIGPALGRDRVDTVKGSKLPNLKELRIQYKGSPWRVLFAFDPLRQAILLAGGCKQGKERWYEKAIPLAEKRYQRHLQELKKEKTHGKKH